MAIKRRFITVKKGTIDKMAASLGCNRATVYNALNYVSNSDLARKIRKEAVSVWGGVESSKVIWQESQPTSGMDAMKVTKVDTHRLWMSNKEAAKYLGVSKDWLKDRRMEGKLHYSVVGNTIFYIKSEIDNLIRSNAICGKQLFSAT